MKIGFDAKRAFTNHRGLGTYGRETIRIMATCAPENQYYLFTPDVDPTIRINRLDNQVVKLPSFYIGSFTRTLWRTFRITSHAEKLGLDVYHGLSHELPYGIEKTKVHTVVTMHDLLFLKQPELFPAFDRKMYCKKYLRSCKVADKVIAVSERTKHDLLELTDTPESKIEVVYQGCSPQFKTLVNETRKKSLKEQYGLPEQFLLNVGAFEPRKNQLLILKALKAGKIDMPLVMAGRTTDYLKELQKYITENGLQNQVKLLPDFPAADLPALYQCASLFVFPSTYERHPRDRRHRQLPGRKRRPRQHLCEPQRRRGAGLAHQRSTLRRAKARVDDAQRPHLHPALLRPNHCRKPDQNL